MLSAQWEAFMCVSMCIGLVYLFRRRWNHQGMVEREMSRAAYAAYLIHEPVITVLAVQTMGVMLYPLLKFGLAAVVAVPLCFVLAVLIRKLPILIGCCEWIAGQNTPPAAQTSPTDTPRWKTSASLNSGHLRGVGGVRRFRWKPETGLHTQLAWRSVPGYNVGGKRGGAWLNS